LKQKSATKRHSSIAPSNDRGDRIHEKRGAENATDPPKRAKLAVERESRKGRQGGQKVTVSEKHNKAGFSDHNKGLFGVL